MSAELHGEGEPAFAAVRDAFAAGFEERGEVGAAVADPDTWAVWRHDMIACSNAMEAVLGLTN